MHLVRLPFTDGPPLIPHLVQFLLVEGGHLADRLGEELRISGRLR